MQVLLDRRPRARRRPARRAPGSRRRAARRPRRRRRRRSRSTCVAPTPRSKMRARMNPGSTSVHQLTFVRLGKSGECSISGPWSSSAIALSSSTLATSIAHCGLPTETCWNVHSRPPATSVPRPSASPVGYCSERVRARPMSTVQLVGEVIVGRISPASVWIENCVGGRPAAPVQVQDRLDASRCPTSPPRTRPG